MGNGVRIRPVFFNSKTFPTYPWNIPHTPNQEFMIRDSWIIWGWKGIHGVCDLGVCWGSLSWTRETHFLRGWTLCRCCFSVLWSRRWGGQLRTWVNTAFFGMDAFYGSDITRMGSEKKWIPAPHLKMYLLYFLSKMVTFQCHVSFQGVYFQQKIQVVRWHFFF